MKAISEMNERELLAAIGLNKRLISNCENTIFKCNKELSEIYKRIDESLLDGYLEEMQNNRMMQSVVKEGDRENEHIRETSSV